MPRLPNARQEALAQARVAGLTVDAADIEAGYKPNRGNAARMNANESVQERIDELTEQAAERAENTGADVIAEIARIGLSDIRKAFDSDGRLLPIPDLPDNFGRAVASI